jgi:hypothetical protein
MLRRLGVIVAGLCAVLGSALAPGEALAGTVARATWREDSFGICSVTFDGFVVAVAHGPADRMAVSFRRNGQWHPLVAKRSVVAGSRLRINQALVAAQGGNGVTLLRVLLRDNGQAGKPDRCRDVWAG